MKIDNVVKIWNNLEDTFIKSGDNDKYRFLCKITGDDGETDLLDLLIQELIIEEPLFSKEQLKEYTRLRKLFEKLKTKLREIDSISSNLDTFVLQVLEGVTVADIVSDLVQIASMDLEDKETEISILDLLSEYNTTDKSYVASPLVGKLKVKNEEDVILYDMNQTQDDFAVGIDSNDFKKKIVSFLLENNLEKQKLLFINKPIEDGISINNKKLKSESLMFNHEGSVIPALIAKLNTVPDITVVVQFV